jgi:hypothetical protein
MDFNLDHTGHVSAVDQRMFAELPSNKHRTAIANQSREKLAQLRESTEGFRTASESQKKMAAVLMGRIQVLEQINETGDHAGKPAEAMRHQAMPGAGDQSHRITYAGTISEHVQRSGGLDPQRQPRVTVPAGTLWPAINRDAAVTYGGSPLAPPYRIGPGVIGLGADRRYLYPVLKTNSLSPTDASVQWVVETARALAAPSTMVRAVDAVTTKPESAVTVVLQSLPLKQVAHKIGGIPNIVFRQSNPDLQGLLNGELRLGLAEALDYLVFQAIGAATIAVGGTGSNMAIRVRKAMTTLEAAGYQPDTVALSPADAEALDLELLATLNSSNTLPNWGLNVRVSKSITTSLVLDASAFATLHAGPVELTSFEENFGGTNSVLVRGELNAQASIDQASAAVALGAAV